MLDELDGAIELVGDAEHVCARDGLGRVRCAANAIGSRLRLAIEGVAIEGATSIGVGGPLLCARLPKARCAVRASAPSRHGWRPRSTTRS
jgi:hypothetical protein